MGKEAIRHIRQELNKIYEGVEDGIADGIAIEKGKAVYVVDSEKNNGEIGFGIRHKLVILDSKLRAEYIRRTNNESIRKGYISDELSSKFGDRYDNNRTSNRGRESGKKLSVDKEQPSNNEGRVSENNGDRGRLKFSLKDSQGRTITSEQREFFKDSKVRDKDGNLLVIYHGSASKFTEFSHRFMNTNGNSHGRGFYFTEDIDYASAYKKDSGQLLEGYLDIKKPASETEITMRKSDLVKLIKHELSDRLIIFV